MSPRCWMLALLAGLVAGCPQGGPTPPVDNTPPLTEPGVTFSISGTLKGPKGFLSTSEVTRTLQAFAEEALPGVQIYLADAKLQPLPDSPRTTTAANGSFELASPHRAGFLMAQTASASAPLMAFYREGRPSTLSVASTMVAWKISADMAAKGVAITTLPPDKIDAAIVLVQKDLVSKSLNPDYSLASWPNALDYHTYQRQGDYAKTFNAIIAGSVAAPMSR